MRSTVRKSDVGVHSGPPKGRSWPMTALTGLITPGQARQAEVDPFLPVAKSMNYDTVRLGAGRCKTEAALDVSRD